MGTATRPAKEDGGKPVTKGATPGVPWLLQADRATLRTENEVAADLLRKMRCGKVKVSVRDLAEIARKIFEVVVEGGPGKLPRGKAQGLLLPLLLLLEEKKKLNTFKSELAAVAKRPDLQTLAEIERLLSPFVSVPAGDGVSDPEPEKANSHAGIGVLNEVLGDVEAGRELSIEKGVGLGTALADVAEAWLKQRPQHAGGTRATVDVWFLRSFLTQGIPINGALAEVIAADDDIWSEPAIASFAEGLVRPLDESAGLTGAVMLNGRLRKLRPRMYFGFPQTLVAVRLGEIADDASTSRELMDLVTTSLLRTIRTIDDERSRGADKRPRKGILEDLRDALEELFYELGYELVPTDQDGTLFTPALHIAFETLNEGDPIVVLQPGLRNVDRGEIVAKALVAKQGARK